MTTTSSPLLHSTRYTATLTPGTVPAYGSLAQFHQPAQIHYFFETHVNHTIIDTDPPAWSRRSAQYLDHPASQTVLQAAPIRYDTCHNQPTPSPNVILASRHQLSDIKLRSSSLLLGHIARSVSSCSTSVLQPYRIPLHRIGPTQPHANAREALETKIFFNIGSFVLRYVRHNVHACRRCDETVLSISVVEEEKG